MAKKRCPVCGKSIAAGAQYCIYCATKFDRVAVSLEVQEEIAPRKKMPAKRSIGLMVSLVSIVVIAIVLLLVFFGPLLPLKEQGVTEPSDAAPVTTTTRDAARDQARQAYVGYWYDEESAGKRDVQKQGGCVLYIEEIFHDFVTFELVSYEGGEGGAIASAMISRAELVDDTLHFTFQNDTLGHAGEGFLRLAEDCIEMEVIIDGQGVLPEEEHTLAVYAVFKRKSLPHSEGQDLAALNTLVKIEKFAGKQTAPVVKEKNGSSTYTFGSLKVNVNEKGELTRVVADYSLEENKARYCYVCVDGTMTYQTVKTYFGEALHDYVERPTNIRVLHYLMEDGAKVTFTFDAENNLLVLLDFNP